MVRQAADASNLNNRVLQMHATTAIFRCGNYLLQATLFGLSPKTADLAFRFIFTSFKYGKLMRTKSFMNATKLFSICPTELYTY